MLLDVEDSCSSSLETTVDAIVDIFCGGREFDGRSAGTVWRTPTGVQLRDKFYLLNAML